MIKWEYKSIGSWITKNDIIHQKTSKEDSFLNELGQQGWELTSIIHTDMKFEEKYRKTMYFKRIIK